MEKYFRAGQAADDNMVHEHCMLGNEGHKHTLTIFNTYCFSATKMVAKKRFNFMFVRTLPALICITTLLHLSQLCSIKWKTDDKEDSRHLSRKVIQIIARKYAGRPTHPTLLVFFTLIIYIEK